MVPLISMADLLQELSVKSSFFFFRRESSFLITRLRILYVYTKFKNTKIDSYAKEQSFNRQIILSDKIITAPFPEFLNSKTDNSCFGIIELNSHCENVINNLEILILWLNMEKYITFRELYTDHNFFINEINFYSNSISSLVFVRI